MDLHSKHILRKMSIQKAYRRKLGQQEFLRNQKGEWHKKKCLHQKEFVAPSNFSIINNTEETISYLNSILEEREQHKIGTHFFINSSKVVNVTVDAILYLIAIIKDTKFNKVHKYSFSGNFPKDKVAKQFYVECGFLSYVHANNNQTCPKRNDKIQIRFGNTVDTFVVKDIYEFVKKYCKINFTDMLKFYPVIVELMSNTRQHAYKDLGESKIPRFWYVFLEYIDNEIRFVFLDTGVGIPSTVYKTLREKAVDVFLGKLLGTSSDAEYVQSTLDGTFRTETEKHNRGQGLPQISDCFKSGLFEDVFILSGKGSCTLKKNNPGEFAKKNFNNKIFGTLFSWKIRQRG